MAMTIRDTSLVIMMCRGAIFSHTTLNLGQAYLGTEGHRTRRRGGTWGVAHGRRHHTKLKPVRRRSGLGTNGRGAWRVAEKRPPTPRPPRQASICSNVLQMHSGHEFAAAVGSDPRGRRGRGPGTCRRPEPRSCILSRPCRLPALMAVGRVILSQWLPPGRARRRGGAGCSL